MKEILLCKMSQDEITQLANQYWGVVEDDYEPNRPPRYDLPPEREKISISEIEQEIGSGLKCINEDLLRIYSLLYLLSTKYCDEFHATKKSFVAEGIGYGFVTSRARLHKGNMRLEFAIRDTKTGYFRSSIPIRKGRSGYTDQTLDKACEHELESKLACSTEAKYRRLRELGRYLKSVVLKLNNTEYLKSYERCHRKNRE